MARKPLSEKEFQKELDKCKKTIRKAIGTLKAKSAGFKSFKEALMICDSTCIKCNAACIVRSPCNTYQCEDNCIITADA